MPFRSQAQRKYMNAAAARGEISPKVVDEFNQSSKGMELPERVDLRPRAAQHKHKSRSKGKMALEAAAEIVNKGRK